VQEAIDHAEAAAALVTATRVPMHQARVVFLVAVAVTHLHVAALPGEHTTASVGRAVELLRAVALGMDLGTTSGAWPEQFKTLDQTLPGDLPDAVVAAIRVGFRRLSPAARQVLASASILDPRVTPELLVQATALSSAVVTTALDELEWHRWMVSEPRGYDFVARVVRQVVARDMLTPGQRRRILERLGRSA